MISAGLTWGNYVYSASIPDQLVNTYSITQYEMYNVVIALKIWAWDWENKKICIYCDNESTVKVCNKAATHDAFLNRCLHKIWLVASTHNITLK